MIALLTCFAASTIFLTNHLFEENFIRGDAFSYFAYLYAWVVEGQLGFSFYPGLPPEISNRLWLGHFNGAYIPRMTFGVAMLQLPFYLTAHLLAPVLGFEANGWTFPYQISAALGGLFWFFLGLQNLQKILFEYFSQRVAGITLVLLVVATNLLYYAGAENTVSHVYSFSLVSIALRFFNDWLKQNQLKILIISFLCIGFTVLIRPTNAVVVIALAGFLFSHKGAFKKVNLKEVLLAAAIGALPVLLQFLYWKVQTGSWLVYTYRDEHLFFSRPMILQGLFSYRNGWLLYTPVMIVAYLGFYPLMKKYPRIALGIFITLVLHVYIVFSWWCWYYGSSLSIRPMVDIYALIAFPLAAITERLVHAPAWARLCSIGIAMLLVVNNLVQIWQYANGWLSGSDMSKKAFYTLLLNLDPPKNIAHLGMWKAPDTDRLKAGLYERCKRDTVVAKHWEVVPDNPVKISRDRVYSPSIEKNATEINTSFDRYLVLEVVVSGADADEKKTLLTLEFVDQRQVVEYHAIPIGEFGKDFSERPVSLKSYWRKPKNMSDSASVKAYVWCNNCSGELIVHRIVMEEIDCPYASP
ncbi:MAG: hypothetical protein Kow0075_02380 [Salibacteraceae bacterium]